MKKALFIGRFQPFHLGHLDAIKQISENEIIIGMGSSQYSGTDENPWSFEERKKMIEESLTACGQPIPPSGTSPYKGDDLINLSNKNIKIIAIPDIHDEDNWVTHVEKIVGDFDTVYTGNPHIKKLFEEKGYKVKNIEIKINISGTELRQMIKENNKNYQKYIPKKICSIS
ncbi:MAG: nicotinamide-nucleotide adenylyltransferase [Candidatus Magasanikbacteria bacterium CG_4_10_14_0_2_um_filter_37_12]|uniref:Nicotinamide-nucleotide adenylyltransferase n=1 Tax=Candidatus Magasanikbacteria bacterium CG_4_10_14_0_2_um_filter_37_12 TaxID=1974637 RepID=A0A2M7V8I2_9BACT|nr:MAG: nicotinamide-nucleotide adenylyltransferase [Candidatus Magasanikbacteria bacterium CG_4_10_14_0_2_um_filter_37_12]